MATAQHADLFPAVEAATAAPVRLPLSPRGAVVFYLNVALMLASTVTVAARVYVRRAVVRNFGADDWAAIGALIIAMVFSGVEIRACIYATGHHLWDLPPGNVKEYLRLLPSMQLIAFAAGFVTRLAILLFLRRLVAGLNWDRAIWFLAAFMTAQWLACTLAFLFQCRPVLALWDRSKTVYCIPDTGFSNLVLSYCGFAVGLDLALWAGPIAIVVSRVVYAKMKIRMIAMFSVGAFAVMCALLKLIYTARMDIRGDISYEIYYSVIFHDLESHVGIIVGCFPALHPFFRWVGRTIIGISTTITKKYSTDGEEHVSTIGSGGKAGGGGGSGGKAGGGGEFFRMHGLRTTDLRTATSNDSQEMMVDLEGR